MGANASTPGKVLMIVENLPVPRDRRVWQEALALRAAGWEVSVICPATDVFPRGHAEIEGIHVWRHPLPTSGGGLAGYALEYAVALAWEFALAWRVLFARGFDVIHACNPPETVFLVGAFFKLLLGKRFVFDHHDLSPELYVAKFGRRGPGHRLLLLLERLTFATADVSIATNESFRQIAILRGGMDPERVFVVRSAPDQSRLNAPAAAAVPDPAIRRGARHLLAYVGVMNSQDGVEYVLEAMRILVAEQGRGDVHAVLMGDGPLLEGLKRMAEKLGVAHAVTFTGWADDDVLVPTLAAADVCVSPDPANDFNHTCTMNKVLEYMALGKPVVMFDLAEGRSSAGDAALYAQGNDSRDLAAKIALLLDDPDMRHRLGELGRARMERELGWNHQVPRLLAAYRALTRRAGEETTEGLADDRP
ncbi:glycosyltransferase family 4 protein [Magnetospirillum sp. UT-4]|uniref:glycosyltransferase family 4 protein n=1 Tax=Magnetospirillum sp. UT-4 TaxID=2681467 RepID=UPI00137EE7F3|nr:glycosyltransferase family 4 protein [Magnetospirillum sp. UT-4]CAA7625486.1 Glycosyl transferase group 1 [Magnetospirillum sp. UT-4]